MGMQMSKMKSCGQRWTQRPLFCGTWTQPEQSQPASHAPLNNEHTGPLAELLEEMATKNTDMQPWSWKLRVSRRISKLSPADVKELEEIYRQKLEKCNGKMQKVRPVV
jgi:hypothetical protein